MSLGGVVINTNVGQAYQDMKSFNTCLYVIMNIVNKATVEIEKTYKKFPAKNEVDRKEAFDNFMAQLPAKDCRFAIYDFEGTKAEGRELNKIIYIFWLV